MNPIPLRSAPEQSPTNEKKPWHRMESEPAQWFQRFQNFVLMGRKRSLLAAYLLDVEADKEVPQGTEKEKDEAPADAKKEIHAAPGSWKRASIRWNWVARAQAYDVARRAEHQARMLEAVYDDAFFASRAARVISLSRIAKVIDDYLVSETTRLPVRMDQRERMSGLMSGIKTLQSILRDIRKEMDELNKEW